MEEDARTGEDAAWVAKAPGRPAYVIWARACPDEDDPTGTSVVVSTREISGAGDAVAGGTYERLHGLSHGALPVVPELHPCCYPPGRSGGGFTRFEPIDPQVALRATWGDLGASPEEHDEALAKALSALPPEVVDEPFEANFPEGTASDEASRRGSDLYFERSVLDGLTDAMFGDPDLSAQALERRSYEACSEYADAMAATVGGSGDSYEADENRAMYFDVLAKELSEARRLARHGRAVPDSLTVPAEANAREMGSVEVANSIAELRDDLATASQANAIWQSSNDITRDSVQAQVTHGSPWAGLHEVGRQSPSVSDVIESALARSVDREDAGTGARGEGESR